MIILDTQMFALLNVATSFDTHLKIKSGYVELESNHAYFETCLEFTIKMEGNIGKTAVFKHTSNLVEAIDFSLGQ